MFPHCLLYTSLIASSSQEEEHDPQFEPVIRLAEQVETKTFEEDEDALFKMYKT